MKSFLFVMFSLLSLTVFADSSWENQVIYTKVGSCETNNLNFKVLRFTKIPLSADKMFLRIIVFIRPDNTQSIRLTTQELLGCQTTNGNEVCSYRPVENHWLESSWLKENDLLNLKELGELSFDENLGTYSIRLPNNFSIAELSGKSFKGNMVLVNFDDHGVNTANLCKTLH